MTRGRKFVYIYILYVMLFIYCNKICNLVVLSHINSKNNSRSVGVLNICHIHIYENYYVEDAHSYILQLSDN